MELVSLSTESKKKIDEYKKFSLLLPKLTNDFGINLMTRMNIIIANNQLLNFKEFVKYTKMMNEQNLYEMKNYFYQHYETALVSSVRRKKLNICVCNKILLYLLVPEYISIQSMSHIFECYIFRTKRNLNIKCFNIKL